MHEIIGKVQNLLSTKGNQAGTLLARQFLFSESPLSKIVELYLYDNEGRPQDLGNFHMMRGIYDYMPRRLLLKCSRKTLKSTLLSNIVTLNMIRYNNYKMLYVAPQELSTKYFSNNYLNVRFESPPLKRILNGFIKNDVFEKILGDTNSSVILRYCKDDASRIRGPATDQNIHDEVQDMFFNVLPIIAETMALSRYKREIFAGTPLTTDNTINTLWKASNQLEWAMKCKACNHWNTLTVDNEPLRMIQEVGFSCSKCCKLIDSNDGQWVEFNPGKRSTIGFHLAQPMLKFFNSTEKEWGEIYAKVTAGKYNLAQIYNEVFGIAYDVGAKRLTREHFEKNICVLGAQGVNPVRECDPPTLYHKQKGRYSVITCGVDWGVNMTTSRTSVCLGGLREDGIYEVFFMRIYKDFDYEKQIEDIAQMINATGAYCACDSGPDPARGVKLAKLTSLQRTQLVRYEAGKTKQRYDAPSGSISPLQNRWCLHRSDTMSFTFEMLEKSKVLFPRIEDSSEGVEDILNIFIEVKEGPLRQELHYRHPPELPDDFFHALNYAVCQAHVWGNNPLLFEMSSTSEDVPWM